MRSIQADSYQGSILITQKSQKQSASATETLQSYRTFSILASYTISNLKRYVTEETSV
jgi:hypothetical protein